MSQELSELRQVLSDFRQQVSQQSQQLAQILALLRARGPLPAPVEIEEETFDEETGCRPVVRHGRGLAAGDRRCACPGDCGCSSDCRLDGGARTGAAAPRDGDDPKPDLSKDDSPIAP